MLLFNFATLQRINSIVKLQMRDGRLVTLQGKLYRVKVYSQLTAIGAVYTITSKQTHLHAVYDDRFAGRVS